MMQLILERKGRGRTNYVVLVNNVVIQSIKHQTGLGSWILDKSSNSARVSCGGNKIFLIKWNIFSDDHTLVQLRPLPGSRRPDYINASFIDGFQRSRAYIATQVQHLKQIWNCNYWAVLAWAGLVSVIRPRPRFIMTNSATHSDNSTLAWQSVSCWEFVTNVSTGSANLHHHSLVLINKRCKLRCDDDGILTVPPPGPPALHPLRVLAPGVGAARARRGHDH